jgi:hypothetical protein
MKTIPPSSRQRSHHSAASRRRSAYRSIVPRRRTWENPEVKVIIVFLLLAALVVQFLKRGPQSSAWIEAGPRPRAVSDTINLLRTRFVIIVCETAIAQ